MSNGPKDANDALKASGPDALKAAVLGAEAVEPPPAPRVMVCFRRPSEVRAFVPPEGWNLAGNHHVQRDSVFVIGGPPGVGKSRAATALAVAGAQGPGASWFGLPIHRKFRTMILQAENGPVRLRDEYAHLTDPIFDECIRVCEPPPYGFAFAAPDFRAQLAAAVREFAPDVVLVDPWNRVSMDDKSKDYLAAFDTLREALAVGGVAPTIGIVAHTRKPQQGERSSGRALLATLAGGYALGSVPRAAFVMQHASDDTEEGRVVWTCVKNNDGELGPRTVWERGNGSFTKVEDFDWDAFDSPTGETRRTITAEDMAAVFDGVTDGMPRKELVDKLKARTGCSTSLCYRVADPKGTFKGALVERVRGKLHYSPR